MYRVKFALRLIAVALPLLLPAAARADGDSEVDMAFWQSIQDSADPAEYQAYLDAFPNGKFAKLALIRIHHPAAAAAAVAIPLPAAAPVAKAAPPIQAATDDADATPAGKILLEPAAPRVGQLIRITCADFPQPTNRDTVVVVPAGTPVMDPDRGAELTKIIWFAYATNCFHVPVQAGPFAPGAYEVRFMTRLYNNDGTAEMHAMTGFRVR